MALLKPPVVNTVINWNRNATVRRVESGHQTSTKDQGQTLGPRPGANGANRI